MPRIVSASRRTDLPAFHARWFMNRVRAGFCHWVHPFNGQVRRVSLVPDDVIAFVFWTRNPGPLARRFPELQTLDRPLLFHFTVTGEGPPVESHNPPLATALRRFDELSDRLGSDAVLWRYDPILISDRVSADDHLARFEKLAARLEGRTRRCTISFTDFYGKTERNLARLEAAEGIAFRRPPEDEKRNLVRRLAMVAAARGMELVSCCDDSLTGEGVGRSRCIDPAAIARASGGPTPVLAARPTRKGCGCVESVDIGAYDTCAFGCAYCYAVGRRATALRRLREADPDDSVLWRPPALRGVDLTRREV